MDGRHLSRSTEQTGQQRTDDDGGAADCSPGPFARFIPQLIVLLFLCL